ncbi:MAG: leucine-rich repeat domain-containing protein [Lachnospiraceae bacterium]|nr:leucine-rich repeat domain-containing protein [Lachnospiraceae bacterium]
MTPVAAVTLYVSSLPSVYGESYYAGLPLKYDRLKNTPSPRIIVIGGSSTAFGTDSKLIEKELGEPCVNFGLYAAIGLKPMLDLSASSIRPGDTVIICPETDSQMYSDYEGYNSLWKSCEGRSDMLFALKADSIPGMAGALKGFLNERNNLSSNAASVSDNNVYALSSFDSYGDISYPRPGNIMSKAYAPDSLPDIDASIVTDDFADMINRYSLMARIKGATVYFAFCPINSLSVSDVSDEQKQAFVNALRSRLDIPVISSLDDHIMDPGFFYDSNFHTNDYGMTYNTMLLINDIKRERGDNSLASTSMPYPVAVSQNGAVISSGSTDILTYDVTDTGIIITGLTQDGKKASSITIPDTIGGSTVTGIASHSFDGSVATSITLPRSINSLSDGAFYGASILRDVILPCGALPEVGEELLDGASANISIKVPVEIYNTYMTDYFWGRYESAINPDN